ncbi:MAG: N-acetyltransferase [Candidatus Hodarchaeales archaeon]|jgi:acetyltransferase-like isoleucine patch superfamily enzyme
MVSTNYISKKATIATSIISQTSFIYGPSKIGENSIIDPSVIIGYPIRSTAKEIMSKNVSKSELNIEYDNYSSGSVLGQFNHIRPFTTIYEETKLADNVETGTNVVIREKTKIGSGSIIGSGTIIDGDVFIGKNARIQSNNFIPPKIKIGDEVFLGPGVRFANDRYPVSSRLIRTNVNNGAIICIGAIILPGIVIGEKSIITAGSIVTKNVPKETVVMGAPAKQVMTRTEYDKKKSAYEQ